MFTRTVSGFSLGATKPSQLIRLDDDIMKFFFPPGLSLVVDFVESVSLRDVVIVHFHSCFLDMRCTPTTNFVRTLVCNFRHKYENEQNIIPGNTGLTDNHNR